MLLPLQGALTIYRVNPGRCPGLGAGCPFSAPALVQKRPAWFWNNFEHPTLQGAFTIDHVNPGRCPGLGAFGPSARAGLCNDRCPLAFLSVIDFQFGPRVLIRRFKKTLLRKFVFTPCFQILNMQMQKRHGTDTKTGTCGYSFLRPNQRLRKAVSTKTRNSETTETQIVCKVLFLPFS